MSDHIAELEARLDRGEGWKGSKEPGVPNVHIHGDRGAVDYKNGKPPVSRFLPLKAGGTQETWGGMNVRNHGNGLYTDSMGRRIVRNESDAKRHEADTGLVRVKPD